jgi:hypothetical protein
MIDDSRRAGGGEGVVDNFELTALCLTETKLHRYFILSVPRPSHPQPGHWTGSLLNRRAADMASYLVAAYTCHLTRNYNVQIPKTNTVAQSYDVGAWICSET